MTTISAMKGVDVTSEIRAVGATNLVYTMVDGKPRIDARAIQYDSWSVDLGGFVERMVPGSVTLEGDLVALFDHDTSKVLGRTSAGTMEVRQNPAGVDFTAYPPETSWAQDLRVSMERGDIKGCSFRMFVDQDKWYVDANGQVCRDVLKARVSELTVTSMPAYPETTAEARSHALTLKKTELEERAGRVLSADNQGRLVLAKDVLDMATELIEKATETIDAVIGTVDPTYVPEGEGDGMEDGCDCGCSCTPDMADPNCTCTDPECAICNPQDPAAEDGASSESRSTDGASAKAASTFVPGFGFITTKEK